MKKRYYNAETLRRELDEFEQRYGMCSEEHYVRRYDATCSLPGVSHFDSAVWADAYREWRRLSGFRAERIGL